MDLSTDEGVAAPGDRREREDRRHRPTAPWSGLLGWQRRRTGRRVSDEGIYVDAFDRRDLALMLAVFFLNVLDAAFTLVYLSQGGTEANPFMAHMLAISDGAFLAQKCFVVGAWLLFLTVHKNFRFARIGLHSLLALYSGVLIYHLVLQSQIP